MIALPSIAFGGFSGSAKDVTARQRDGRSILTVRCWPTGQKTNAQAVRRASLAKITKSYKMLTESQMQEWERLAQQASGASAFGQKAELSGINLYVRLNANKVMAGESMITDAPAALGNVPDASYRLAVVSPSMVVFQGIKHQPAPNKLVVKMSAVVSPGISNGWSKTVIVSPDTEDDWGEADLTTLYTKTIGITPEVGQKVFIEVYWMNTATGVTGQVSRGSVICLTDEEAAALVGGSRARYTEEDLMPGSTVTECDIEFTTGAPVIFFDVLSQGMEGVAQSEIYVDKPWPENSRGTVYVLNREKKENSYHIGVLNGVIKETYDHKNSAVFNAAAGTIGKPGEIFGAGILV
jgi:hypothetical protein